MDREAREELRRAARTIADELRRGRPGARHAQGALLLLSGDPDRAIAALEAALTEAPGHPAVLSDLAAAFLVRASTRPQPLDPIAALDHAAAGRRPALPEALFNRALARQRLALSGQSARAWADFLARDPEPGWAEEARAALATLAAASGMDGWAAERQRLQTAARRGDPGAVAAIVRRHRQEARTFAEEELLEAWADREQDGRKDQPWAELDLARAIGRSLEEISGEAMLADTVAAIDRAREADPERLAAIAAGLGAYAEGLERVTARQFARAEEPLGRAQRFLEAGRCPFAGWTAFLLLRCAYQRSDFAAVQRQAGELLARWDEARYPVLAGRTRWVLGTTQMALGRPAEALRSYRLALARFQRAGERGHLAAVHVLLASAWQELGDAGEAWRHRNLALRAGRLERSGPPAHRPHRSGHGRRRNGLRAGGARPPDRGPGPRPARGRAPADRHGPAQPGRSPGPYRRRGAGSSGCRDRVRRPPGSRISRCGSWPLPAGRGRRTSCGTGSRPASPSSAMRPSRTGCSSGSSAGRGSACGSRGSRRSGSRSGSSGWGTGVTPSRRSGSTTR